MNVRFVTSLREFDALAPSWSTVTREGGQRSPFLSHDWFACCWRTAGPNRRREVWVLEDGVGPAGLVPLLRYNGKLRGLPVRMLRFLDAPDTPFADFPMARGTEDVITTFLDTLRHRTDWDVLSFTNVPVESPTFKALTAALPGQFPWRVRSTEQSPYLRVTGTWEDFLHSKSQRFRKTLRNVENRLARSGRVTVEEHTQVDPGGRIFAEVMEVSRQSWKGVRGVAMATMLGMPRFFTELTERASSRGWLHLWILRMDGRPVATEYQIGANGCVNALRADFDSSLAELSPGTYLNMCIIRTLFDREGIEEYNMGPGSNEYKYRWASDTHESAALEIYAPTTYGRILHALETRLVPAARRWRAQLRGECA